MLSSVKNGDIIDSTHNWDFVYVCVCKTKFITCDTLDSFIMGLPLVMYIIKSSCL